MICSGNPRACALAIPLAAVVLALGACGSDSPDTPTKPAIPTATANQLAALSDEVASELDAGQTCTAAGAADDLLAAVQDADLPPSLSSGVESAAQSLVNEVNCPPPPEPEHKKDEHKKDEKQKKADEQLENPSGHLPPGHAKGQD